MSNFNVGFVIFPDLTQLDFTGPLQVLARLPQSTTHIIAKSEAPVPSDCGLSLVPTDVAILFLFIAGCCSLIPVRGRRWSSGDRC
jgi:transcriptional regulator GlxA family with amidase domain